MKNRDAWRPTKYVRTSAGWTASRDPADVTIISRLFADILAERYAAAIGAHARGDLLDHGCGQLPLLGMYEDRVTSVTAVDWSGSLHPIEHADQLADLNQPMPFADESFDTVVSSDVVEHLWNPVAVFDDFARVLRPGGILIVGTPFNYWLHEVPHDYFRWSPFAIRTLGSRSGLRVVDMRLCGGHREVLIDTLAKSLRFPGGTMAAAALQAVARATGFASVSRSGEASLTLGTVSVLRRASDPG